MQALQNSFAAQNSCFKVGGPGVAELRSSKMSVHGSTSRICEAGVGRIRLGSRSNRLLDCTSARPRTISNSVESRAVSVNASMKKGESSEASRPGNSLVELAGELEVGSEDSVSQTGAATSEFHVDRSHIPGWSQRALLLFPFFLWACRCPMIMGGYPVYEYSELVSLNPPRLFSSIRSSPECVLCFCELTWTLFFCTFFFLRKSLRMEMQRVFGITES